VPDLPIISVYTTVGDAEKKEAEKKKKSKGKSAEDEEEDDDDYDDEDEYDEDDKEETQKPTESAQSGQSERTRAIFGRKIWCDFLQGSLNFRRRYVPQVPK
jgi:TATA-binding protein-associated factor Taf7